MAQPYIGEIRMFAGTFAPVGWMFCNGQTLPISENEVLFQLISTTYGGDGETSFNLPNLQSRVPMHFGNGPDGLAYPFASMAGTEAETLTTNQIPVHSHPLLGSSSLSDASSPAGNVVAQSGQVSVYIEDMPTVNMHSGAIGPVGGSQPHDNMQPFLGINFIISLFGIFPSPT